MIICSPDNPGTDGGVYTLPYIEATEGKRHGYDGGPSHGIQWTRNAYHPADPYCPECKPKGRTDD